MGRIRDRKPLLLLGSLLSLLLITILFLACDGMFRDHQDPEIEIKGEAYVEVNAMTLVEAKILEVKVENKEELHGARSFVLGNELGEWSARREIGETTYQYTLQNEVILLLLGSQGEVLAVSSIRAEEYKGPIALYAPSEDAHISYSEAYYPPMLLGQHTILAESRALFGDSQAIPFLTFYREDRGLFIMDDIAYDFGYAFDDQEKFDGIFGDKLKEKNFNIDHLDLFFCLPDKAHFVDAKTGAPLSNQEREERIRSLNSFYASLVDPFPQATVDAQGERSGHQYLYEAKIVSVDGLEATHFSHNLNEFVPLGQTLETSLTEDRMTLYLLKIDQALERVIAENGSLWAYFYQGFNEEPRLEDFAAFYRAVDLSPSNVLPVLPPYGEDPSLSSRLLLEQGLENLLLTGLEWDSRSPREVKLLFEAFEPLLEDAQYQIFLQYQEGRRVSAEELLLVLGDQSSFSVETPLSQVAGEAFELAIFQGIDNYGEDLEGVRRATVTSDIEGEVFDGEVLFSSGEGKISVALTEAGEHQLTIEVEDIRESASTSLEILPAGVNDGTADGSGTTAALAIAGDKTTGVAFEILVILEDAFGNPITQRGEDDFSLRDNGENDIELLSVRYEELGSYRLVVKKAAVESVDLTVTADDVPIADRVSVTISSKVYVGSSEELIEAVQNQGIDHIVFTDDIAQTLRGATKIQRPLTIDFGVFTLTGDVLFEHSLEGTSILEGVRDIKSILGSLEVNTPYASFHNRVEVRDGITITGIAEESWRELAYGNTLILRDSTGASITIIGGVDAVEVATDAGGNIVIIISEGASIDSIVVNAPVHIENRGAIHTLVARAQTSIKAHGGSSINTVNATEDAPVVVTGEAAHLVTGDHVLSSVDGTIEVFTLLQLKFVLKNEDIDVIILADTPVFQSGSTISLTEEETESIVEPVEIEAVNDAIVIKLHAVAGPNHEVMGGEQVEIVVLPGAPFTVTAHPLEEQQVDLPFELLLSQLQDSYGNMLFSDDYILVVISSIDGEVFRGEVFFEEGEGERILSLTTVGAHSLAIVVDGEEVGEVEVEVKPVSPAHIVVDDVEVMAGEEGSFTALVTNKNDHPLEGVAVLVKETGDLGGIEVGAIEETLEDGYAMFSFFEERVGSYSVLLELVDDAMISETVVVTIFPVSARSISLSGDEELESQGLPISGLFTASLDKEIEGVEVYFTLDGFEIEDVDSISEGEIGDLFAGGVVIESDDGGESQLVITFAGGVHKEGKVIAAIYEERPLVIEDAGDIVEIVVDTREKESAALSLEQVEYYLHDPEDVTTGITWNEAQSIESISFGAIALVLGNDYVIEEDDGETATLRIKKDFIESQDPTHGDELPLTIVFDVGDTATLTVLVLLPEMGGAVTISGDLRYGSTLVADTSNITYTPSTDNDVPSYQWYRSGSAIAGATSSSYTLGSLDIGQTMSVGVSADGVHAIGSVISSSTSSVDRASGPSAPTGIGKTDETIEGANDGTLTGTQAGQEYQKDGGTWISISSTTVTGLAPGRYRVRWAETATHYAGASTGALVINPGDLLVPANLSHDVMDDALTLLSLIVGYDEGAPSEATITVTASGIHTNVMAVLESGDTSAFIITNGDMGSMAHEEASSFSLKAVDGLLKGTYEALVKITSEEFASGVSFTVTQEVLPNDGSTTSWIHYRWVITEIQDIGNIEAVGVQASEFQFYNLDGYPEEWGDVAITNPGGNNPSGETVDKLIDGDLNSKWLDFSITTENPPYSYTGDHSIVVFAFSSPKTFAGYRWATAASIEESARDPKSWTIEASNDGEHWTFLHGVSGFVTNGHPEWQTPVEDYWKFAWAPGAPITGLELPEHVLQIGETVTRTAETTEEGATDWTSSNTDVATIDSTTGVVTALTAGETTITYNTSTSERVNSIEIQVFAAATINNPMIGDVWVDGSDVTPTGYTTPGDDETIEWTSSNIAVATIDSTTGIITAVETGNTIISYKVTEGATGRVVAKGEIEISVKEWISPTAPSTTTSSLLLDGMTGLATASSPISSLHSSDALTIAAWIKPSFATLPTGSNGSGDAWEIVSIAKALTSGTSQYLGFRIERDSKNLQMGIDNGVSWTSVLSDSPITEGQWTHVAMVIESNGWSVTFYMNGNLVGTGTVDRPLDTLDTFTIGALRMYRGDSLVTEHHFNGQIDEVQVWNTALSGDDIRQYIMTPPSPNTPNLLGLWLLDEGTGTSANDSSGNGRHATLYGIASWEPLISIDAILTGIPEETLVMDSVVSEDTTTVPITVTGSSIDVASNDEEVATVTVSAISNPSYGAAATITITAIGTGTATITVTAGGIGEGDLTSKEFDVIVGFAGGRGTVEDPYKIATAEQLCNVRNHLSAHYVLIDDINLENYLSESGDGYNDGEGWQPLGDSSTPFTGTFDGINKTISNLYIFKTNEDYIGFFGKIGLGAVVKNLGIVSGTVTGGERVGALSGELENGTIDNCHAAVTVIGMKRFVGGLVGRNDGGVIKDSYATGNVTEKGDDSIGSNNGFAGGLTGQNTDASTIIPVIENCHATGAVTSERGNNLGGLVGQNWGVVRDSYATGSVTAAVTTTGNNNQENNIGGLIGFSGYRRNGGGIVEKSYAGGLVNSLEAKTTDKINTGGLVGKNYGSGADIRLSYAIGTVTGSSTGGSNANSGGLVGVNENGAINDSYAIVSVSGYCAGGLLGKNSGGTVNNTYAAGLVMGEGVGGLVEYNYSGVVKYSYFDTYTTGQTSSGGGTGKTTAEMTQQSTFAEWEFTGDPPTWAIQEGFSYPYLQWQTTNIPQVEVGVLEVEMSSASAAWDGDNLVVTVTYTGDLLNPLGTVTATQFTLAYETGGPGSQEPDLLTLHDTDNDKLLITFNNYADIDVDGADRTLAYTEGANPLKDADDREVKTPDGFQVSVPDKPVGATIDPEAAEYDLDDPANVTTVITWNDASVVEEVYCGEVALTVVEDYTLTDIVGATATLTILDDYLATQLLADEDEVVLTISFDEGDNATFTIIAKSEFHEGDGSPDNPFLITTPRHLDNVRNYLGEVHSDKYFKLHDNIDLEDYLREGNPGYNGGAGWEPIGDYLTPFTGTFDGNNKTISNLFIHRPEDDDIGLFGYNSSSAKLLNIHLKDVSITGSNKVGGLIGFILGEAIIKNVGLENVNVIGEVHVGGLVGFAEEYEGNGTTITDCYVTGNVTGAIDVGGLVGLNIGGNITNSYTTASVTAMEEAGGNGNYRFGGLVGEHYNGSITNCYATGAIIGDNITDVGGLVGYSSGPIIASYYNQETTGQSDTGKGIPSTTTQMNQQATYMNWDFVEVWGINANENNSYPFLRWQNYTHISNAAEILTFCFTQQTDEAVINSELGTIAIEVEYVTDVTNLVANFTTSLAIQSIKIGTIDQVSGETANDFQSPVIYVVTAEDESIKEWTVTVTVAFIHPEFSSAQITAGEESKLLVTFDEDIEVVEGGEGYEGFSISTDKEATYGPLSITGFSEIASDRTVVLLLNREVRYDETLQVSYTEGKIVSLEDASEALDFSDKPVTNESQVASVGNSTELLAMLGNETITKIFFTNNITQDLTDINKITRALTMDFQAYTLTGDVLIHHTALEASSLQGTATPSIEGTLTIDTASASFTNHVKISGDTIIENVSAGSFTEHGEGNTIIIKDIDGATIIINASPTSVCISEDSITGLILTLNAPVNTMVVDGNNVQMIVHNNIIGDVTINGSSATLNLDEEIEGALLIAADGGASIHGLKKVTGNVTLEGSTSFHHLETIDGNLTIKAENLTISISTGITGSLHMDGANTLTLSGPSALNKATIYGGVTTANEVKTLRLNNLIFESNVNLSGAYYGSILAPRFTNCVFNHSISHLPNWTRFHDVIFDFDNHTIIIEPPDVIDFWNCTFQNTKDPVIGPNLIIHQSGHLRLGFNENTVRFSAHTGLQVESVSSNTTELRKATFEDDSHFIIEENALGEIKIWETGTTKSNAFHPGALIQILGGSKVTLDNVVIERGETYPILTIGEGVGECILKDSQIDRDLHLFVDTTFKGLMSTNLVKLLKNLTILFGDLADTWNLRDDLDLNNQTLTLSSPGIIAGDGDGVKITCTADNTSAELVITGGITLRDIGFDGEVDIIDVQSGAILTLEGSINNLGNSLAVAGLLAIHPEAQLTNEMKITGIEDPETLPHNGVDLVIQGASEGLFQLENFTVYDGVIITLELLDSNASWSATAPEGLNSNGIWYVNTNNFDYGYAVDDLEVTVEGSTLTIILHGGIHGKHNVSQRVNELYIWGSNVLDLEDMESDVEVKMTVGGVETTFTIVKEFAGGSGTEGDPYLISKVSHLSNMNNYPGNAFTDKHFRLENDLDLNISPYNTGEGFEPIGYVYEQFTGTFDGNEKTIRNLFIHRPDTSDVGLFGFIDGATIKDLTLEDPQVTGKDWVGALVGGGLNSSSITGITIIGGSVTGENEVVGGIVGFIGNSSIEGSSSSSRISGNNLVGGAIGYADNTTVDDTHATGAVEGNDIVGGLIGYFYNSGTLVNSSSTGNVIGKSVVGGLVGFNTGFIMNSHAEGSVQGETKVGGLVGVGWYVDSSYSLGDVEGIESVGGLIGYNVGLVANSYALNEQLIRTSGGYATFGRISGNIVGGLIKLEYNFANEQMIEPFTGAFNRRTHNDKDGADITSWSIDNGILTPSPTIALYSPILVGDVVPVVDIILVGDTFHIGAGVLANWEISLGDTGLTLSVINKHVEDDQMVTLSFTGTAEPGTIQIQAKAGALTGTDASNVIEILLENPTIATTSVIYSGDRDPVVEITLLNGSFDEEFLVVDQGNWDIQTGDIYLTVDEIIYYYETQTVHIVFSGIAESGTISIQAKADALEGTRPSNTIEVPIMPIISTTSVIHFEQEDPVLHIILLGDGFDAIGGLEPNNWSIATGDTALMVDTIISPLENNRMAIITFSGTAQPGTIQIQAKKEALQGNAPSTIIEIIVPAWEELGAAGFSSQAVEHISLDVDGYGTPYVAYSDSSGVWVKSYSGSSWSNVGSNPVFSGSVNGVSFFINNVDVPFLAYSVDDGDNIGVWVYKYDGGVWQPFNNGSGPSNPQVSTTLASAIYLNNISNINDTLLLAYSDSSGIWAKRALEYSYDWVDIVAGGPAVTWLNKTATSLSLTYILSMGGSGYYLAFIDDESNLKVLYQKDLTPWEELADAVANPSGADSVSIGDIYGAPTLTYSTSSGTSRGVFIKSYNNGQWWDFFVSPVFESDAKQASISSIDPGPYPSSVFVAFQDVLDGKAKVLSLEEIGEEVLGWVSVGNVSDGTAPSISLASYYEVVDPTTLYVEMVVAYKDVTESGKLTVKRYGFFRQITGGPGG